MRVKEFIHLLNKNYSPDDHIYVQWWDQEDLLGFISDAMDTEVLDLPVDCIPEIVNQLDDEGVDSQQGVREETVRLFKMWMRVQSQKYKANDYDADTPLGQQYGDGAEVDQ